MEKEIPFKGGDVDLKLEKGQFVVSAKGSIDTVGVSLGASVGVSTDQFFDFLAAKIPGKVDDAIFAVMKEACKAL